MFERIGYDVNSDGELTLRARAYGVQLSFYRFGRHSLLFSGTLYRRVNPRSILFDLPIYIGGSLEAGDVFQYRSDLSLDRLTVAGSGFVGLDSPIGPVYLGYGANDQSNERFYFSIGRFFR